MTYSKFASVLHFSLSSFKYGGLLIFSTALLIMILLSMLFPAGRAVFSENSAGGSFYNAAEAVIILISAALFFFAAASFVKSLSSFWSFINGNSPGLRTKSILKTFADILTLRYLDGYGDGCNYEDESFSAQRRRMHQMIFYGFALTFIATLTAAFYEHLYGINPPYGYFSLPVILGASGGALQIVGIIGMLWLKLKSDKAPYYERLFGFEISFSLLLLFVNFSGFLVLILRETSLGKLMFIVHIGFVWSLFLYLPYSKFAHAIYRFAALVYFHNALR